MILRRLLLVSLLWSTPSWAAITIDGTPTTGGGINTNNISISHSSTAATLALACVFERDTTLAMGAGPSVTYGGNAMTLVPGATQTQATRVKASLFYYVNPPTGSQTVAMTRSTNANRYIMSVITLAGTATTSIFNTAGTAGGDTGTDLDINTLASAAGEFGVACGGQSTNAPAFSADATSPVSTEQVDADITALDSIGVSHFIYTEDGASSSIDMRVDSDTSQYWSMVAVSIRPAATTTVRPRAVVVYP